MARRVIERIGVKVIPDLTGFRAELRSKLQAMPGLSVEIEAHLGNLSKVRADIERITRDRDLTIRADFRHDAAAMREFQRVTDDIADKWDDFDRDREDGARARSRAERAAYDERQRQLDGLMRANRDMERHVRDAHTSLKRLAEDGTKLDRDRIRQIRRDWEDFITGLEDEAIDVEIQLDDSAKERFKQNLDQLIRDYDDTDIDFEANADTFFASRQLSWVSRTRIVDLYVRVNEKSLTAAATAIAALSGGRLLGEVGSDIWDFFKDLDKNIPSWTMWMTGIVNLTGTLLGLTTQIVSFSADLARISHMFLTLPGLIMGGAAALLVTINAWQNVKEELEELADPLTNLREAMSDAYWAEARQPIRDMVMNLMPQLEVVLTNASRAMGSFAGAFATALEHQLGGGRLEQIFDTMAEGFDILAQGADGYAGTIVNLALIAGEYWPRLADWMNRQATAFSNWLDAIATDGRLDFWMERAIDNLYELGYGLADMGRLLRGITEAAEAAGAAGLAGFHDTMERWQEVINSPNGQRALIDYFTGGRIAAEGLGEAIENIFVPLSRISDAVRDALAQSGSTVAELGGLFGDVLGDRSFWNGIETMLARMESGIAKLRDASDEVAEFLGAAAELTGHFADALAGPLSAALEVILPRLSSLQDPIERLLTALTDALEGLIRSGAFERLMDNLVDLVEIVVDLAIDAIPVVLPALETLLSIVSSIPPEMLLIAGGATILSGGMIRLAQGIWPTVSALLNMNTAALTSSTSMGRLGGAMKGLGWAALAAAAVAAFKLIGDHIQASIASVAEWENALKTAGETASLFTSGDRGWWQGASSGWLMDAAGISDVDQVLNALDKIDLVRARSWMDPFGWSSESQMLNSIENMGDALAQLYTQSVPEAQRAFRNMWEELGASEEQMRTLISASDTFQDALMRQATAMGINVSGLSDMETESLLLALATGDYSHAVGDALTQLDGYVDQLQKTTGELESAEAATDRLLDTQKRANSEFWATEEAARSFAENVERFSGLLDDIDFSEAVTDGWFDYGTQAGIDLSRGFQQYIDSTNISLEQMLADPQVTLDELKNTFGTAYQDIVSAGLEAGLSPSAIRDLIGQLYSIFDLDPHEVERRMRDSLPDNPSWVASARADAAAAVASIREEFDAGIEQHIPIATETLGGLLSDGFGKAGVDSIGALVGGISDNSGAAIGEITDLSDLMDEVMAGLPVKSLRHGGDLSKSLGDGIRDQNDIPAGESRRVRDLLNQVLSELPSKARTHGENMSKSLGSGINAERSRVKAAARAAATAARVELTALSSSGHGIGSSLGSGIAAGISSKVGAIAGAAAAAVRAATNAAKAAGDIHSPSRLWEREIGYQLAAGGARGIRAGSLLMDAEARRAVPDAPSFATGAAGGSGGVTIKQEVHPAPGMDESEIADIGLRKMAFALRSI